MDMPLDFATCRIDDKANLLLKVWRGKKGGFFGQ
jgi:hypothetical protein